MNDVMEQDSLCAAEYKMHESAAEMLIEGSLAAQSLLVASDEIRVIPAIAESPIPVLAARNRTPDPLNDVSDCEAEVL